MELSVARVGAILGPFIAGTLQQIYHSATPMFVSIGAAAVLAGVAVLFVRPVEGEQATITTQTSSVSGQIPVPAQPGFH
jgi:AAHS family 4-hydroxybenzoate transporter-like MFS transporter